MISEKFNCIFIHIPKAAGQSIGHFFLNLHGLTWNDRSSLLLKYNPDPEKGPERLAHLTAAEYLKCGYADEATFNSYYKFSFVRNPWARLASEFNYADYHKTMSFEDFVTKGLPAKSDYSDAYRHILPQYDFLYDSSGKCLVDFIGRYEYLQEDFDEICTHLNIKNSKLPYINSSPHNKSPMDPLYIFSKLMGTRKKNFYTEMYNDKTRAIVEDLYHKDIEIFNYKFGGRTERPGLAV